MLAAHRVLHAPVSSGGATPTIDGTAAVVGTSISLSTTASNDLIVIDIVTNGGPILSVSGSTLGAFTLQNRSNTGNAAYTMERWYAIASGPLSSETITPTPTSSSFMSLVAYGVAGANTGSPWGASASISGNPADPVGLTTTGANELVVAGFRTNSTGSPTVGSGATLIGSASSGYGLSEYENAPTAGSYSLGLTTGSGDSNASVIDSIVPA